MPSFRQPLALLLLCCLPAGAKEQQWKIPARAPSALTGSAFAAQVASLSLEERDSLVLDQIRAGNVPSFLRSFHPITLTQVTGDKTNSATVHVCPDYLAIGSDADYLLMPISPMAAQAIADFSDCSLPTTKVVDSIYRSAECKLEPLPIAPNAAMTSVAVFSNHNAMILRQRANLNVALPTTNLVAGHKKDLVLTSGLNENPGKVAIYGWHRTNAVAIQPLYLGHTCTWVDYSQCARLIAQSMLVNGKPGRFSDILKDPGLCALLSDESGLLPEKFPIALVRSSREKLSVPLEGSEPRVAPPIPLPPNEVNTEYSFHPDVRIWINSAPAIQSEQAPQRLLIVYALPNGNTIEQTIGRITGAADDWHFNIQHIAAQTRFLRLRLPGHQISIAYLQAKEKSWPAWRKAHPDKIIPGIMDAVKHLAYAGKDTRIALESHSGGGSLIFGYLNAVETIPPAVTRIGFLDSDYGYDSKLGHDRKLSYWLNGAGDAHLTIIAYNDAAALLDGKSFVTKTGGTWGKSFELLNDLAREYKFTSATNGDLASFSTLNGRVQFLLMENPNRKILHTVQVERNGLIHCLLTGSPLENKDYRYFGDRAYEHLIQP
jgi:hypothetical protein